MYALPPPLVVLGLALPSYAFKKVYDEALLSGVKHMMVEFFELCKVKDNAHKHHNHHGVFPSSLLDKYLHYLIFNGTIWASEYFGLIALLFPATNIVAASLMTAAILGAALQGDPTCSAQKQISTSPLLALLIGASNGMLCCGIQHLIMHFFSTSIGFGACGSVLGFIVNWGLSAEYMCQIEGAIALVVGLGDSVSLEAEKSKDCCNH